MKRLISLIIAQLMSIFLNAQTPLGFSYQAVVRNTEGQPVAEQTVGVRISLQDEGGTAVHYSETHSVMTSPQGVISLIVGEGTAVSGVFADIQWASGTIYLKVEVDPTGGTAYSEL